MEKHVLDVIIEVLGHKATGEVDLRNLAKIIIRGGWPANLNYSAKDASEAIIRSSVRVNQSKKRYFADPSIACSILNIREENKLINDLNTFGFLFEALVERDFKIYADSFNAKCYHYQDYQDKEIDSIIELENGNWCAMEFM